MQNNTMQSFYLTLSSNTSKINSELTQNLKLTDSWYVGVSEISIFKKRYNLLTRQNVNLVLYSRNHKDSRKYYSSSLYSIAPGYYSAAQLQIELDHAIRQLCEEYNNGLNNVYKIRTYPTLNLSENLFVPGLDTTGKNVYLEFDNQLEKLIGMGVIEARIENAFKQYFMNEAFEVDLEGLSFEKIKGTGFKTDYSVLNDVAVHCDACRFNYIDGEITDKLCSIDISDGRELCCRRRFDRIDYFPVSSYDIKDINLNLRKNSEEISLGDGKFSVTLHFIDKGIAPFRVMEPENDFDESNSQDSQVSFISTIADLIKDINQ